MITKNVSQAALAALSRIKCEDRSEIEGTSFQGEEIIRVTYNMKCGKSHERPCWPKVPWKDVALAALSKVNDATMQKILQQALDEDARKELEKEHKPKVEAEFQALVNMHRVHVRGRITGDVILEGVDVGLELLEPKKAFGS